MWGIKGLAFGLLVLLFPGAPLMFIDGAFSYGPPLLTWPLFAALFVAYGLAVGAIVDGLEKRWPVAGQRNIVTIVAFVPLALLGLISVPVVVPFYH